MVSLSFFLKSHRRRRSPVFCSSALRMNALSVTPGTSSGFWKDRKMPFFARSLTGSSVKNDRTAGYAVGRIAGDGIAQRRLAGAVGAHQHMGLILSHGQIHTVENFFFLDPHVQVLNL